MASRQVEGVVDWAQSLTHWASPVVLRLTSDETRIAYTASQTRSSGRRGRAQPFLGEETGAEEADGDC